MKKDQIVDMIGEAPDQYVKDAGEYRKRRIRRSFHLIGGIAAILVVALLAIRLPNVPLAISAKAISVATEPQLKSYKELSDEERKAWWASRDLRNNLRNTALPSLVDFAERASREVLIGTDSANRIWSPINAYIAIAITAELTEGEGQTELFSLLDVESTEMLRERIRALWESIYTNDSHEISLLANSLWLDNNLSYAQDKMDILARDYYASVYQGDLGSDTINRAITNWMKNQTGGFLANRTGSIDLKPEQQMLTLVSTIYFQAKWSNEFNKSLNTNGIFHTSDGDVSTTFMNQNRAKIYYYWSENYGAVRLYMKNGASMWLILPDEDKSVNDVLLDNNYMKMITESAEFSAENCKYMMVNLSVPQFDVSASIDLKDSLQRMGITKIFDDKQSVFSPSLQSKLSDDPVYLDSIHQDAHVKIDEKGVTAASYIELNFGAGAAEPPNEIIDFVLDRPFIFAITQEQLPLFVGTVNTP